VTPETVIGGLTALVGLLGAVAGLLQIVRSFRASSSPAAAVTSLDVDDHLIDELVRARVELELARRDYSGQRGPTPGTA